MRPITVARTLTACAVLVGLTACAATGPAEYSPAGKSQFGYTNTRIEANRFRVIYRGSGSQPAEQVEDFALRRAAELTLSNEADWFRIVDRQIEGDERGGVSVGGGFGTGTRSRRSGVGVGVGGDFGRIGAQAFYTVRLEILIGANPKPENTNAYDARSILGVPTGN